MPFIRLSDNYIDHPKFIALSSAAFRLWHEGMAFCRKHQTDGIITRSALAGFRYSSDAAREELLQPCDVHRQPLWRLDEIGYHVHDYLDWNPSRAEEEAQRRRDARRKKRWRMGHKRDGGRDAGQYAGRDADVLDRYGTDRTKEKSDENRAEIGAPKLPEKRDGEARSKRPIFKGNRLIVFEWQLDDLMKILGPCVDEFDLHAWFFALDSEVVSKRFLIPKRDGGAWLQAQLLSEAKRRGFAIGGSSSDAPALPFAWTCKSCGQVHEGTRDDAKRGVCLRPAS